MTKFDVLINEGNNIELTVALPVYNSKKIAWVCLEGLCNQIDVDFEWELIIYEEEHENSCFPSILDDYIDRLKNVNCKKIIFLTNNEKVPLITKWLEIAKKSSDTSVAYVLQPADCYSHKKRLKVTYDKIVNEGYNWYDQKTGNFYSLISDRIITYNFNAITNLCIATLTSVMRKLPNSTQPSGIDGYTYKHVISTLGENFKKYLDTNIYEDGLDIHGLNNISHRREGYFDTKTEIFKKNNLSLFELTEIPKYILDKIYSLRKKNDYDYDISILISTYENVEYLNECFTSIENSIGNLKVEVLVGIDSCLKTKEYVLKNSFSDNFKFFFFEKNNGPYIVFNTLSKLVSSQNILFFGSDDVMCENMIGDCYNGLLKYDCVKPSYTNFFNGKEYNSQTKKHVGEGVFAIKKDIFEYMNGFEPWICAADSDFMARLYGLKKYDFTLTNKINFYRRIHKNGLTSRLDTGMGSKLRAHYLTLAKQRNSIGPIKKMVTEQYTLISADNTKISKKEIKNEYTSKVEKNISSLKLLQNKNTEPKPIKNYLKQEIKNKPKPQIKERPPIESKPKEDVTFNKETNDQSLLSNKAKDYIVDKKIQELKVKPKGYNVGKDSLRI